MDALGEILPYLFTFFVLVNGSPTLEFYLERGLRHSDIVSSFIFILAMKGLNVSTDDAILHDFYSGTSIRKEGIDIS